MRTYVVFTSIILAPGAFASVCARTHVRIYKRDLALAFLLSDLVQAWHDICAYTIFQRGSEKFLDSWEGFRRHWKY